MPAAPKILIIRLSALGDVVMSSGLIPALRSLHPKARLSWLCEASAVPLLKHNPELHEVIVWPRAAWKQLAQARRWRELWSQVSAFRRELRAREFDVVIDIHGLLKSALLSWMTGCRHRIGLRPREGGQFIMHERVETPPGWPHVIGNEYRYLARHLGAPDGAYRLDVAVGQAPHQTAARVLAAQGVKGAFVALAPFTTRAQKHWFEDRWVTLADRLAAQGLQPVLVGGPDDGPAATRIAAEAHRQGVALVNLTGQLKLDESVALLAKARAVIGVDTGLTHLGSALRRPTVVLFGSTHPYSDGDSPGTRILYDALPCSPCRRSPTCGGRFDCMRQLSVDRVFLAATDAMAALP